jgi:hypothetical protein
MVIEEPTGLRALAEESRDREPAENKRESVPSDSVD